MNISEIIAHTQDGIIVINNNGTIEYRNEAFNTILGLNDNDTQKYVEIMKKTSDTRNDSFHQVILDAICQSEVLVKANPTFYQENGKRLFLAVSAKRYSDSVVFTISDITELEERRMREKDASFILTGITSFLCLWVYFVKIWNLYIDPQANFTAFVTYLLIAIALYMSVFSVRKTKVLRFENMGLAIKNKKALLFDAVLSIGFFLIACLIKLLLLQFAPGIIKYPAFFNPAFFLSTSGFLYPISVIGQEFAGRGFVGEVYNVLLEGPHRKMYGLIVSSLFFGALHVHRSLSYMIVTPIFMFVCGLLYERQGNIWGICIIHYTLLMSAKVLGFM